MGCVAFLFNQKGVIDISLEDKDADEAMMDALDAGAEDFDASEDAAEITTDPENYSAVVKALEEKGYEILSLSLIHICCGGCYRFCQGHQEWQGQEAEHHHLSRKEAQIGREHV